MRAWRKSISAGELNARNHKSMLRIFAWAAHSVTLSAQNSGLPEFGTLSQTEVGNIRLRLGEGIRAPCWITDGNLALRVNNIGY
jgi:hypothetical protein